MLTVLLAAVCHLGAVPRPNQRQLEFMDLETIQFMHFGLPTFWKPTDKFLHGVNPTYGGNCQVKVTGTSNDSQTGDGYWPCLRPGLFNPTGELDVHQWMAASASLGMKEICLTAKHFGGFTLWSSKFTPYGVAASPWKGGRGDVLREFADAANEWGIKICYYSNPRDDGYLAQKMGNISADDFITRQMGMLTELMDNYGPVNRFWFDGGPANVKPDPQSRPAGVTSPLVYSRAAELIRSHSPSTLISPYRGDVCSTTETLYTRDQPQPNSTDSTGCVDPDESGKYFHPSEMHGITMQEGNDGNTDARPTYWFWHDWACAGNVTGCPWVGHANASRIFNSYIATVGHGSVLNMNIPPTATGRMNASVVQVMAEAGKAINDTFKLNNAGSVSDVSGGCIKGVASIVPTGDFDYIVTSEDLARGQRIGNYSVEYRKHGSDEWEMLVPPVVASLNEATRGSKSLRDRPDGNDPRDSHVGHKRIDVPKNGVTTSGAAALNIAEVRFNCISRVKAAVDAGALQVYLKRFSLHKRAVPWERKKRSDPNGSYFVAGFAPLSLSSSDASAVAAVGNHAKANDALPATKAAAAAAAGRTNTTTNNICPTYSKSFPDDGDEPDCAFPCGLAHPFFGGAAYKLTSQGSPPQPPTSVQAFSESMERAGGIMRKHGTVIDTEAAGSLHLSLQYLCCQSMEDAVKVEKVWNSMEWPLLNVTFSHAVCRVDYDDTPDGLYTSVIVLLENSSNTLMEQFVSNVESKIAAAGVNLTVMRKSQQPFHSTLGAVHTNTTNYDIAAALDEINAVIKPGRWHSTPVLLKTPSFSTYPGDAVATLDPVV